MTSPVVVRRATVDDLAATARISVEAYTGAGQLDDGPDGFYGTVLADTGSRESDALLLVAVRQEQVVGTVTICTPASPFREIGREGEVEFRFLAVAPEAWGHGVGDALVAACEEHARSTGSNRLVICVRDINSAAMTLYARHGFQRLPERDWHPVPQVALLAFEKNLG
tara:strand:- start:857 stop:1360 length:504 start_codon:yes stop_codon:yes gene_type:complete